MSAPKISFGKMMPPLTSTLPNPDLAVKPKLEPILEPKPELKPEPILEPKQKPEQVELSKPAKTSDKPLLNRPAAVATTIDKNSLWIDKFQVKKQQHVVQQPSQESRRDPRQKLQLKQETRQENKQVIRRQPDENMQENNLPVVPASVQHLLGLPPELHQQLSDLSASTVVPSGLIAALWRTLESNTRNNEHCWQFVETDGCINYNDDAVFIATELPDVVFGRFRDIRLVRQTALPDRVRSGILEVPCFLHANHVDLGCGRHFIAGQKPVPGEIAGFQRMLIEHDVGLIVDLTRNMEQRQPGVYIPEQNTKLPPSAGQPCVVSYIESRQLKDLPAVSQSLRISDGHSNNELQRLHFFEWPDHEIIAVNTLIALADKVDSLDTDPKRAIFVHCMAGMGRSGTLISFLAARRRLRQIIASSNNSLNTEIVLRIVFEVVARGRVSRGPSFVQTQEQFALLSRTLLKDLLRESSPAH